MADFSTLIASIEATIKQNGVQAITGQVLQDELLLMVSAMNQLKQDTLEGYAFYGEALPNGATRVVTQNTFFLAGAGSYTINGNAVTISDSGISVIVYDCIGDEITTYLLFAYDANPTSGSANAVTSGGVKSALDTKADKNGASPDLFAGFAGNLVDTRSAGTRQGPFAFRQSGGDGVNYMRKILGKTEAFNQLAKMFSSFTANNCTITYGADTITVVVETGGPTANFRIDMSDSIFVSGHKYLMRIEPNFTQGVNSLRMGNSSNVWQESNEYIYTAHDASGVFALRVETTAAEGTYVVKYPTLVDLTLEGLGLTTADQFRALHPLPYYNYNAGVLKNNAATGLETTGFNQWDEEWLNGYYQPDGTYIEANTRICSKNKIKVYGGVDYYIRSPKAMTIFFFDEGFNNLGGAISTQNAVFQTPANCAYILFYCTYTDYGSVYNHDICINFSDASRNGIYEPYWKREIVLGLDNLPCHDENNNAVVVNGLDGVGTSRDELIVENGWGTKIIKRRGRRAYQAGDESDATLMTDGTNTDYPLPAPKVLTLDNPIPALIEVDSLGTEERLPADTADNPQAPFESDSNYSVSTANLVRKLSE